MPISYITLDEFSKKCGIKSQTIKKRYEEIPGIQKSGNTYLVLEGTRYPVDKRKVKPKTREEKVYYLLNAISEERYISSDILGLYDEQFNELLVELQKLKLISKNSLCNEHGANQYDITSDGIALLHNKKDEAIRRIINTMAEAGGTFLGSAYATANN